MNPNNNSKLSTCFIYFSIMFSTAFCQPTKTEYLITTAKISAFLYSQYGMHTDVPNNILTQKPNDLDAKIRSNLRWKNNGDIAKELSDVLLYGFFVGSIPLSPLLTKNNYMNTLLTNLEVLSINGLVTNIIKHAVKRQRPYSHYGTFPDNDDSYRSFFSGHTSTAFAIGTSTAMTLTRNSNLNENLLWGSILCTATMTGYLRIAADKHYATDVITGAIVGTLIGGFINNRNVNRFDKTHGISYRDNGLYIYVRL